MTKLSIDIETYASVDLAECGVYRYAEEAELLLFAYAYDNDPVEVVSVAEGEEIPDRVLYDLVNPYVVKCAWNANFERTILSKVLNTYMEPRQWECTMVRALYLGFPGSLDSVSKLLNTSEKMKEGEALIRYFSKPCKPTIKNSGRLRNLPEHDSAKWELFIKYCARDVEAERDIRTKLEKFPFPESEQELWVLDQEINDTGVLVDMDLVESAIRMYNNNQRQVIEKAKDLTGVDNPKSGTQIKQWLKDNGLEVDSLDKEAVSALLKETTGDIKKVLELKQGMGKTSVQKYEAIKRAVCKDGRVRGLLQFYGARTGRWSGRLVQVQNLPKSSMEDADLDVCRQLLKQNSVAFEALYDTPVALSDLIRTAFIPERRNRFIVADFSAIEARVIAWLAGEQWRQEVFQTHGKIYEASAAQMFKVPIESIGKGSPLRQKGKIAELALGYQGGVGAMLKMGAIKMGLQEEELKPIVDQWRNANPNIVKLWNEIQDAATHCISNKRAIKCKGLEFEYRKGFMFITLPSGRVLSYIRAKVEKDGWKQQISYTGIDQETRQWKTISTYGGKLVENLVQAISRDCLAEAMIRVKEAGYKTVMHVHDEIIVEAMIVFNSELEEVLDILSRPIEWAPGLLLKADGYMCDYYKKD